MSTVALNKAIIAIVQEKNMIEYITRSDKWNEKNSLVIIK
jgi:hypothetical protein